MCTRVWLLAAAALLPASLAAQTVTTSASLTGRLTDASGSAVAGATISAARIERRQTWTALTDAAGRFRFVSLPLGTYRVEVAMTGFASLVRTVTLAVGETLDLPLTLEVAGVTAAVEVNAEPPIVDTARTQIAGRITPDQVDSLPLNGR
jgi:hypothetical protein